MANFGPTAPGHENRGWRLFVVTVVMIIVSGFFVVVRLSARYIRNGIRVDDWVIVAALTAAVGFSIAHVLAVQHGFGRHEHELTPQERIDALIWIFVAQVLYKVILCLTKTSIVLLYLRVFYAQKSFRWTCYVLIAFNIVSGIAFIPPTIWQCSPVHAFWDRSVPHRCIKNLANWLSYALINILTDVAILILPIRQVMHLQEPDPRLDMEHHRNKHRHNLRLPAYDPTTALDTLSEPLLQFRAQRIKTTQQPSQQLEEPESRSPNRRAFDPYELEHTVGPP
ncbi:hypothetical protein RJZ56_007656 [Blastomyces dermatitidis]